GRAPLPVVLRNVIEQKKVHEGHRTPVFPGESNPIEPSSRIMEMPRFRREPMPRHALPFVLVAVLATTAFAQASFQNFETALAHPIRVSNDGTLLFVANAPDNRLEVYSLADPANPLLLRVIPVGLEPCSVAPRTNDEIWVVNNLSDSVSIVSLAAGR